jgi:hypothetical protein
MIINYNATTIQWKTIKYIKIETEEDVGLDDKIKPGENESPCFAAGKIVKGSKQNKIKYLCDV